MFVVVYCYLFFFVGLEINSFLSFLGIFKSRFIIVCDGERSVIFEVWGEVWMGDFGFWLSVGCVWE